MSPEITVIGAGLAGCEAAWQAAKRGCKVTLVEMKPSQKTPAHTSPLFAELVCSNSFRASAITNAIGLLKAELARMGSLIMEAAYACEVPAGGALAVDRTRFAEYITNAIRKHPSITVVEKECTTLPTEGVTVVATGPLTSPALSDEIQAKIQAGRLHFFDAAAPIVDAETLDHDKVYLASRYGKGEASYLNCPMTREEYDRFYQALITAEEAPLHDFDRKEQESLTVFEGCMPVEVMAKRGYETLLYGPLKPVGLPDPKTGKEPFAVVQLRQENTARTMYNLVGFQTHLTFGAQKAVFSLIPGLENASFLRYGVMHRNTYLDSPRLLNATYATRQAPDLFFAGQMTGVEGYIESTASGFVAGLNAARRAAGAEPILFPDTTVIGAMAAYVSNEAVTEFQPMNANFGLIAPLGRKVKGGKRARNEALAERSLSEIDSLLARLNQPLYTE